MPVKTWSSPSCISAWVNLGTEEAAATGSNASESFGFNASAAPPVSNDSTQTPTSDSELILGYNNMTIRVPMTCSEAQEIMNVLWERRMACLAQHEMARKRL
ncbi:hypothetical protein MIND_00674100 [Mycena indigotica]|uniref:Uncharacterized protein n=1 Tax=Mycena indigotica TaxID=2126181 RepID=A0A8H6SKJ9_9AGAR|nr:uncharacterized protein MIND_00674100 [Mycena indigotica]KAF7301101.1 hypothetical protein MIND_00674100 [Mycena indigotica]